MDNYQNICHNNENSEVIDNIQLDLKSNDFYNHGVTGNDGFHYMLVMHKTVRMLIFAKFAEYNRITI
jgi:hypothetical protein